MEINMLKYVSENLLAEGIDIRISTSGQSMFPLIKTGERIIISAKRTYAIGDIIVYKLGSAMVCHRIVKVFDSCGVRYYQTRGDSFLHLDEPVTVDRILGRVIRIERDSVTIPRRILLRIYSVLSYGRLSAAIITMLIKLRAVFSSAKKQF
jgi:signal peptidase I